MKRFSPESVPESFTPDQQAWLMRQFRALGDSISTAHNFDQLYQFPGKEQDGMERYFPNGPNGPGFYGLVNGVWTKVSTEQDLDILRANILSNFVAAAYGGIRLSAPVATPDIPATTYIPVPFDDVATTTPDNVIQHPVASTLTIEEQGTYLMSINMSFTQVESQQGRTIYIAIWDITAGVEIGNPLPIAIARNQPGTNIALTTMIDIGLAGVNNVLRLEIGGGNAIDVTQWAATNWSVTHISQYKGILT